MPKGPVAGALDGREDGALIREADLTLGGMDIDVDLAGIDQQVQHGQWETIGLAQSAIGLFDREGEVAVVNAPPIDKDDHVIPSAPMQGGWADQPAYG